MNGKNGKTIESFRTCCQFDDVMCSLLTIILFILIVKKNPNLDRKIQICINVNMQLGHPHNYHEDILKFQFLGKSIWGNKVTFDNNDNEIIHICRHKLPIWLNI